MTEANEMTTPSPSPSDDGASGGSIWTIIGQVFGAPRKGFENFRERPNWIVPLILVLVLAGTAGMLMAGHNAELQYELMRKSTILPPAAIEEMRAQAEDPDSVSGLFGGIVILIISLLEALLALFLGKIVLGGDKDARFKQIWGVGLLSALIAQLGMLLRVPLVFAKDSLHVSLGLAALMPNGNFTSFMYTVLYYLDIFMIWAIIVGGIGYSVIFKVSGGKGQFVSWTTGLLFVLLMIGLQFIGLGFAGVETSFF